MLITDWYFFSLSRISRHNISTHILNMHKNTKRVRCVCEVCGKGFESQSLLADHAVVHIDRSLIEVQCNICGRWQKTQRSLKAHHKRHKRHTPQQCGHCDKILYSANEMKVHIAQFHEMRKHQCSICKKAFIRPIRLRVCYRIFSNIIYSNVHSTILIY